MGENNLTGYSLKPDYLKLLIVSIFLLLISVFLQLTEYNRTLFLILNNSSQYINPVIWSNLTILGDTAIVTLFLLPLIRRKPDIILAAVLAGILTGISVHIFKQLINVPRPPAVFNPESFTVIGPSYRAHSFPSGHSCTVFSLSAICMLFEKNKFKKIAFLIFASVIAYTRICVGVHWPSDITGGAFLGVFFAIVSYYTVRKLTIGKSQYLCHLWAVLLIVNGFYVLFIYNTHYPMSLLFQRIISVVFIIWGGFEYGGLWISRYHPLVKKIS